MLLQVNHSREALVAYLKKATLNKPLFDSVQASLYRLLVENSNNNRYPITIIKTYEYLFTTGLMDVLDKQLLADILSAVWEQIRKSDDVVKVCAGSVLICSLLRYKGRHRRRFAAFEQALDDLRIEFIELQLN